MSPEAVTRSQTVARIADRTASQLNSISTAAVSDIGP